MTMTPVYSAPGETRAELQARIQARVALAERWICPDCGATLAHVPAQGLHPGYGPDALARKCPACPYYCTLDERTVEVPQ